ncbi:calpain, small subunit 1, isoform CRA_b [Rattus norvegicus]|uniref:Calpain, small subunit 1, isoform CRA_b n=1 Tax=Rattus norvegicus TaxID=10116 RepID=A6J9U6_RAT|nr:calpain, small subunit 1, isoform CRA_b [Rattus norvegicus]EDM07789.1 calpain, small subunit 1, isoform CRA_b [Rattus norvegicus]
MSQGPCLSSGRITPVPTHLVTHSHSYLPGSQINSRPSSATHPSAYACTVFPLHSCRAQEEINSPFAASFRL